jgi:hypothetical protein
LTEILHKDISLISLPNPQNPVPLPGAYRFLNTPADWKEFIRNLLANSKLIFLYITFPSPGIITEVNILKAGQYLDKTIVIFGREFPIIIWNEWHKEFKHVVHETGAKQWTRKHEKTFHKNVIERLSAFEAETNQKGKILDVDEKKISLVSPPRWYLALKLFIPPLFWFYIAFIFLVKVIYQDYRDIPDWDPIRYKPMAVLGINLFIYLMVRYSMGFDRQSDSYIEEDKIKSIWNSQQKQ